MLTNHTDLVAVSDCCRVAGAHGLGNGGQCRVVSAVRFMNIDFNSNSTYYYFR